MHKDKITLPDFGRPALPVKVAKVPKPSKAELEGVICRGVIDD